RRAGEERLARAEQILAAKRLLAYLDPLVPPQFEQQLAGNARQQPGVERRRQRRPAADDEQAGRRPPGPLAPPVPPHALAGAAPPRTTNRLAVVHSASSPRQFRIAPS